MDEFYITTRSADSVIPGLSPEQYDGFTHSIYKQWAISTHVGFLYGVGRQCRREIHAGNRTRQATQRRIL